MNIILLYNIIFLLFCLCCIKNIYKATLLYIPLLVLIPYHVRVIFSGISFNFHDLLSIIYVLSFYCTNNRIKYPLQSKIQKYIFIYIFIMGIVTTMYHIVPLKVIVVDYIKNYILKIYLPIIIIYRIICIHGPILLIRIFCYTSLMTGIYGIFSYIFQFNPYISYVSLIYLDGDNQFEYLLNESRGGLSGRTSGTMYHPLAWGQYNSLVLSLLFVLLYNKFLFVKNKYVNNIVYVSFFIVALANVLLCGSRTALLSSAFVCLIYFYKTFKFYYVQYISISSVVVLLLINTDTIPYIDYLKSTIYFWDDKSSAITTGSSASMRLEQFSRCFELLSGIEYFTGKGLGYILYNHNLGKTDVIMMGYESLIYHKITEVGIIGLLSFLVFLKKMYEEILNKTKSNFIPFILFIPYIISILMTGIQLSFIFFLFTYVCASYKIDSLR